MSVQDEEIVQQDANTEETSAPQPESTDSEVQSSAEKSEETAEQPEKQVPFHEHPRFKELIEYRRQSEERLSAYEKQIGELRQQYTKAMEAQKPAKPVNPFVDALKKIDPAYGEWAEQMEARASKAEDLERRIAEFEQKQFASQAVNTVNSLHEQNKVPAELRDLYNAQLIAAETQGRIRNLNDIQAVYKQIHDAYTKVFETRDRATRAQYVTDKSKDNSMPPSQPKGKVPARNEKGQFTGDREHDLAIIARRALKLSKAESDI